MAIVVGVWAVKKLRFMALKLLFSPILTPIPVQGYLTRKYYSAYWCGKRISDTIAPTQMPEKLY
jgi:hypothetical protein